MKKNLLKPIVVAILLVALTAYFVVSGSSFVKLPDGLEIGLSTKINYADGTSDTIATKLSPASIELSRNEKSVQNIVYTPYIKSKSARNINISYTATGVDNTKNVILSKGVPARQIIITGDKVNKEILLEPLVIPASEIVNRAIPTTMSTPTYTAYTVDLRAIVLVNANKLESEIITFKVRKIPYTGITTPIPTPPTGTPPTGYTPYPTPPPPCRLPEGCNNTTIGVRLVAINISGGFRIV